MQRETFNVGGGFKRGGEADNVRRMDDRIRSIETPDADAAPGGGWGGWLKSLFRLPSRKRGHETAAFTSAFVSLAGKLAAADGVAVNAEAEAFERFLEVGPRDRENVRRVYDHAKQDVTGFEVYADRIGCMLADEPAIKRNVFECLMFVACADGVLHPAEDHFLKTVAHRLGYSDTDFRQIRALFLHDPESPYAVLEIEPDASDEAIKARYRAIVAEHHPDLMMARGLPPAAIKAANAKLASVNAAYEAIRQERRAGAQA